MPVLKDTEGYFKTGLYTKLTDTHMYVHFTSYRSRYQPISILHCQDICLRRICRIPELFWEATRQLTENLQYNNFSLRIGYHFYNHPHSRTVNKDTPFTKMYYPFNLPIGKIIRKKEKTFSHPRQNCRSFWHIISRMLTRELWTWNTYKNWHQTHIFLKDQTRVIDRVFMLVLETIYPHQYLDN